MYRRCLLALITIGMVTSGCTTPVPEPPDLAPGTPHVTWVIMFGGPQNPDREFSCQSGSGECVLPASKSDDQVFSDVHFYFHGVGQETRYEGTTSISFLEGNQTRASHTDITVYKNESITNQSTTGIVTSTPGTYTVTLDLTATVKDTGKQQPVRQSFQVRVQ